MIKTYILVLILIFISINSKTNAALTCFGNSQSELHPSSAPNVNTNTEKIASSKWLISSSVYFTAVTSMSSNVLIDCRGGVANKPATALNKVATFDVLKGSNIINEYRNSTGIYYKIKGTSNHFLNDHAYIRFLFSDIDLTNLSDIQILRNQITNVVSGGTYVQGIKFTGITFLFDAAPSQRITNFPINIGTLSLSLNEPDGSSPTTYEQVVRLFIDIEPRKITTCSLTDQSINLDRINTSDFASVNVTEKGKKTFTIRANCGNSTLLASTLLNAIIMDNNDLSNISEVLSNTSQNNNIGFKIYESGTTNAIKLQQEFTFGKTQSYSLGTSQYYAEKSFDVKYHRIISGQSISAGKVSAQAMISVFYD